MSAPAHDHHCPACQAGLRQAFSSQFKVGDVIAGYSTRKLMKITAIGKRRFLYEEPNSHRKGEYVAAIAGAHGWELIEAAQN